MQCSPPGFRLLNGPAASIEAELRLNAWVMVLSVSFCVAHNLPEEKYYYRIDVMIRQSTFSRQ